jgi:hypothetical protein
VQPPARKFRSNRNNPEACASRKNEGFEGRMVDGFLSLWVYFAALLKRFFTLEWQNKPINL